MLKWFVRHWKISLSLFAICVGVFVFFLAMIGSAFVVLTGSSDSGGGASTTTGGLKITASELAKKANIPEKKLSMSSTLPINCLYLRGLQYKELQVL